MDHPSQRRQARDDFPVSVRDGPALARIVVTITDDQDDGLDLPETVEHRPGPEVGRGRTEHRPAGRTPEHADHRLRAVRQQGRHALAGLHLHFIEKRLESSGLGPQRIPAQAPRPGAALLVLGNHRILRAGSPQQVGRKVQPGLGKEARLPHPFGIDKGRRAGFSQHVAEPPDV